MSYTKPASITDICNRVLSGRKNTYHPTVRPYIPDNHKRKKRSNKKEQHLRVRPSVEVVLSQTHALSMIRVLDRASIHLASMKKSAHSQGELVTELWQDEADAVAWLRKQISGQTL